MDGFKRDAYNKIKERDKLAKKLDDLIPETKSDQKVVPLMSKRSQDWIEYERRLWGEDTNKNRIRFTFTPEELKRRAKYGEVRHHEYLKNFTIDDNIGYLTIDENIYESRKEGWSSGNWFYIVGAVILILLLTQLMKIFQPQTFIN